MTPDTPHILIADDDETARLLMRAALRKAGYEVSLAEDGADALRLFALQRFDMVMLDIDMPGLTGHQVCTALRAEAGQWLPILMVTGMDDIDSIERAFDSGATDFVAKPINWGLIGHRVKYMLRANQASLDLQAAEARGAAILQAIPDLLYEMDIEGRYIQFHSPSSSLTTPPVSSLIGKTVNEILPPDAAQICLAALQAAQDHGASTGQRFEMPTGAGTSWFELSIACKKAPAGEPARFIVLSRDITERMDSERQIRQLAFFDSLTGLPNRQSFVDRVEREVRRARQGGAGFGILFMDLDGFKDVNDTLGHSAGDQALKVVADRLREAVRSADLVCRPSDAKADVEIARLGGDEFTALILNIQHPEEALVVAQRILLLMRQPFFLDDREIFLTTSIGIALYGDDGDDAPTLLKHADAAMYLAKDSGRDNTQFYNASLTEITLLRMALEHDLRLAVEREQFSLVYQPVFDAAQGRICGVEALIRWNRPSHGWVAPLDFIPLAEQLGLIIGIGQWVLRTACQDAADWLHDGLDLWVAVNLSPSQFKDPNLVQSVLGVLTQTGLPARLLELEVTESTVMEDTAATMSTLKAFKDSGVEIALDDFGTGYSSLSYLTRMPLSKLKIDQSFVVGLPDDRENLAIVRAILAMAGNLNLSITAEGVETQEQARMLSDMGCDLLQGYYFSKPVPAAAVPALLHRWRLDRLPLLKVG
jgi:diguanylate cyclase (GGDEF)-like protein